MVKKVKEEKKVSQVDESAVAKESIEELLKLLEVDGEFEFSFSKNEQSKEEEINIVLDTKDGGIVIGYHGEILESLQLIASLMISKKLGRFVRVSIDVGDYKKNREEFLKSLAIQTKEKVLSENKELSLPNLKSWERRVIHLILQEDGEVITESVGEGRDRMLVVKPK